MTDTSFFWQMAGELALLPVMSLGGLGAEVTGGVARGGEATVDLYRAVGVREFQAVMRTGKFVPAGNSLEGRQFARSLAEALKYADTDVSKVAILKVTVRREALKSLDFSLHIDPHIFRGGVFTVQPGKQSLIFHQNLLSITHAL